MIVGLQSQARSPAHLMYGQEAWLAFMPDFRYPGSRPTELLPHFEPFASLIRALTGVDLRSTFGVGHLRFSSRH